MELTAIKIISHVRGQKIIEYFIKERGKNVEKIDDINSLINDTHLTIVSFNVTSMIENINTLANVNFIDIELIKKQLVGRPKNEFKKGSQPWDFWNMFMEVLKKDYQDEHLEKMRTAKKIFLGYGSAFTSEEIKFYCSLLVESIESIYNQLKEEIITTSEYGRFRDIEFPITRICNKRTKAGIRIDSKKIKTHIKSINDQVYYIRNKLQLEYGIYTKTDSGNIRNALEACFGHCPIEMNNSKFFNFLKFYKDENALIKLLYDERKLSINKSILTRLGSFDSKRVFPTFNYFGTITARINVESPALQQISQDYRDIFQSDEGMEFIYIDYSQFEAGILASEADDPNLISIYNDGDIYDHMQNVLEINNSNRKKCKQLFFAYCYGMSLDRIKNTFGVDVQPFFNQFEKLAHFKQKLISEFQMDGYVETAYGNRRFKSIDNTEAEVEDWLISQRIQGNASLILKKAISMVEKSNREIEFVLPMHDAVLYQVSLGTTDEKSRILEGAFHKAFKEVCPKINPKVSFDAFFKPKLTL